MDNAELTNRFTYHPPDDVRGYDHGTARSIGLRAAYDLNTLLPEGREKALAITKIEEAVFWANASLARAQ